MSLKNSSAIQMRILFLLLMFLILTYWLIKKHGVSDLGPCFGVFLFLVLIKSSKNKNTQYKISWAICPFFVS